MKTYTSQSVFIEEGAIKRLRELVEELNAKRIFFVVDKPAFEFSGAEKAITNCLKSRQVEWFSNFELNPKIEDVELGIELFRNSNPDVLIALGGGSALDMAKLIGTCGVQDQPPLSYIIGEQTLKKVSPPMVAIPTTSGTGSEATHFAVVYVEAKKYSLAHQTMQPEYALVDPELTYSLPAKTTATCGLDALCQAVESTWAVGATNESIQYSVTSLKLALDHLEDAVNNPNPEARRGMAIAAHYAGKAINITKTTAPHAFSYAVTTQYNVPHGAAVALTLGAFLSYNYQVDGNSCNDPRGPDSVKSRIEHVLKLLGDGSIKKTQNRLQSIIKKIGCPVSFSDVGIQKKDLPDLIGEVNMERLANNPRIIDTREWVNLLQRIL